jgi:glycosyltransferase involved in cell wall biosynthesis
MNSSLTVIIPALNEAPHIANTVHETIEALQATVEDYEITIFNDGSTDRTGVISDELAKDNPRIEVIHHDSPRGLGYVYKAGVRRATKEYVLMVPGDNEVHRDSVYEVCKEVGETDIVITYHANPEIRSRSRQVISKMFAGVIRYGSGLNIRYFNGLVVHRTDIVRRALSEISDGFAYQAEILVRLIQLGLAYKEVGLTILPRPKTNAFRLSNLINTIGNTFKLVCRLKFKENTFSLPEAPTVATGAVQPVPTWKM